MFGLSIRLLIDLFSVFGAGFALWKGGIAERLGAGVVIANVLIGDVGQWLAPDAEGVIRLCNDGFAALALLVVTVRYGALWMGGAMLFYAAQFSLHSYYLVTDRSDRDYLHAAINNLDWTGIIWCLIIGTLVAWRHRWRAPASPEVPAP
ncbi:MAG TPA: hypothetical protein VLI41_05325 [Phenylobacterium sp.]|uniref:hypothetical protein n=1 Tax=Phenylobacterium sp. TaxID=1871053 RepID=UPI002CEAA5A4|nr:hypothetical protein [Phenylobacterium sp.]HSV02608.1 hypothetical protein [Phenylobacterium sp.]